MFRIGIIGTENSHAMAFSRNINLPDPVIGDIPYSDVRVVGVYGPDIESARIIKAETGADFIAKSVEEFHGKVDAMMITSRKGSVHSEYAMPFIEKGMPLFIDKPFTSDVTEAEKLILAAQKSGSKLCGGSSCRRAYDVLMLQNSVRNLRASGDIISASMNFAADPDSEYDGFYFYASHLVEMALTVFGHDVRSIICVEKDGSRLCIWRYDDIDVSLHFTKDNYNSSAVIYAKSGNIMRNIDMSLVYQHEVAQFVHMLRTGEMLEPYENLVLPVRMIAAVEESAVKRTEVRV